MRTVVWITLDIMKFMSQQSIIHPIIKILEWVIGYF